ncbi:MAG: thioredoxin family protein [Acholeplasmatales bacterium]|nr:thioredoxin family protein [Acholeplasmatales bacterium]
MWLNKDNFKDYLKGITVVEVSGESCANCLTLMPILDSIVKSRNDCKLYHIEANEDTMDLINMFEVKTIPTVLVLNDLEVIASCRGYQPEEILELWIDSKIEDIKKIKK